MRLLLFLCLLFIPSFSFAQFNTPEDFGLYRIPFLFEKDTVEILIRAHPKSYKEKKPLLLFVQGSLPRPLCIFNKKGQRFSTFPFDLLPYLEKYHFAIISKPGIPIIAQAKDLSNFNFKEKKTNAFPRKYCKNNHLDYYVNRNKAVLDFLSKKNWVDENKIIVVGHSEGVEISFKMAIEKTKMSHLILLNAGLAGRIMSLIINARLEETITKDTMRTEELFRYWGSIINTNGEFSDDCSKGDSHKATASFSYLYRQHLQEIAMPVFFGYGTKDESVLLMDYLRVQAIRLKKKNFYFKSYFGLEHNFFGLKKDGTVNHDDYQFDRVANDFFEWLKKH